ncbi:MAG: methylated-DNA--[protein]-cysteine S-methyltransferase [Candidatus Neomarinimicrobiota bacterium]
MIAYTEIESPIGRITLARSTAGLCYLALPGLAERLQPFITHHFPGERLTENQTALQVEIAQLGEYFAGTRRSFKLALDLQTASFFRLALAEVAKVPYGTTVSYGEIARRLGRPKAVRAVGGANAANPLPIVIPCHRILAGDGRLNGYAGGLEMKAQLLRLEGLPF